MGSSFFKPLFACWLALLSLATSAAQAAEPSPSELSVARQLFAEGKAAEDAGRWAEAADKLRRAVAIKDTPGIRFHLARCEEEQGANVEALIEYDRAAELIEAGAKAGDVAKLLPEARQRVLAKVAMLTLHAPEDVLDVSIELNGKPVAVTVLGVAMPVNPGHQRLRAVAPGRSTFLREFELRAGEARELGLALPPERSKAPALVAAPASSASTPARQAESSAADDGLSARSVVLVSEATLFVAALGTGVAFTFVHSAASDRYEQANQQVLEGAGADPGNMACLMPLPGCSELAAAKQDRDRAAVIQTASFIAAGVSAAAFGLTYWLWPSGSTSLQAGAAPGRADLVLSGSF